jgi:hypothetical protein
MIATMSYKLFDQGYSTEEIMLLKQNQHVEDVAMEQLLKWRESEVVLSILRTIKASEKEFTKMEMEAWRRAMARR